MLNLWIRVSFLKKLFCQEEKEGEKEKKEEEKEEEKEGGERKRKQ